MNIQLIEGDFSSTDALDLIEKIIKIKIKYHEDKIEKNVFEEAVKYRETKIKKLQNELLELRNTIHSNNKNIKIEATIKIE